MPEPTALKKECYFQQEKLRASVWFQSIKYISCPTEIPRITSEVLCRKGTIFFSGQM